MANKFTDTDKMGKYADYCQKKACSFGISSKKNYICSTLLTIR